MGTGALAAAAKYAEQDYEKLITWKAGAPVPYSMLANTFEVLLVGLDPCAPCPELDTCTYPMPGA